MALVRLVAQLNRSTRACLSVGMVMGDQPWSGPRVAGAAKELVLDKLTMSRIMGALRSEVVTVEAIARKLGVDGLEVARHLHLLSQQGMVRMDADQVQLAVAA